MRPIELTAPSAWASYLINGDASGLDSLDIERADDFAEFAIESGANGGPVGCEDAGFIRYHDARVFTDCPYAADCQTYTFLEDGS